MAAVETGLRPAPKRVLIIKPSSLGDVVHGLPVLAALRSAYPHAHIAWLVGTGFASLLERHPLLDDVIPFDRKRYGTLWHNPRAAADFLRFLKQLRDRKFNLVIDLQGLVRSAFFAWVSAAPGRIGFSDAREFAPVFYSRRVRCPAKQEHAVDKNRQVLAALGLPTKPVRFPLGLRPNERDEVRAMLREAANSSLATFTAVLPGARWPSKQWQADQLACVIDHLADGGYPPAVLLGAPDDAPFAAQVAGMTRAPTVDLTGRTTLRQLVALLDLSALVICHDSGPMHIAAALNKPTVAVFGPTNPDRTGPYSKLARVVRLDLPCMPCLRRTCPLGHHDCMRQLRADRVVAAVRELAPPPAPAATLTGHA